MAKRPVFIANNKGGQYVTIQMVDFNWFPGMSVGQKQKSIASLHKMTSLMIRDQKVLEISSKSTQFLGIKLSAFNLNITTKISNKTFSVESAYQASKVFQNGGPYVDILNQPSREAKRDARLRNSGPLKCFYFAKTYWPLYPPFLFYDWLYINALSKHKNLASEIMGYTAFTDIEFNPNKSLNCQAHAAALFVSLRNRGLLTKALSSRNKFIELVSQSKVPDDFKISENRLNKLVRLFPTDVEVSRKNNSDPVEKPLTLWDSHPL